MLRRHFSATPETPVLHWKRNTVQVPQDQANEGCQLGMQASHSSTGLHAPCLYIVPIYKPLAPPLPRPSSSAAVASQSGLVTSQAGDGIRQAAAKQLTCRLWFRLDRVSRLCQINRGLGRFSSQPKLTGLACFRDLPRQSWARRSAPGIAPKNRARTEMTSLWTAIAVQPS